jgi:biopolymer transport protein ExbD
MKNGLFFKKTAYPSEAAGDVHELDLTPFMSVFVILLPYLITMVVFTHLAFLRFSLPPNVGAGLGNMSEKPKLKITVVVAQDFLAITYGETMLDSIASINGEYNVTLFSEKLKQRKAVTDLQDELVVASRDRVRFKHVVKVMDLCRDAGFQKIGLSQATQNAEKGR